MSRLVAAFGGGVLALSACCDRAQPRIVSAPSPVASVRAEPRPLPDAGRVEELAGGDCVFEANRALTGLVALPLYATSSDVTLGSVWANSHYEQARFRVPPGDGSVAVADIDGFGATARGLVEMAKVPLWVRPTRRLAGGMLTPNLKTQVELILVDLDGAVVKLSRHSLIDSAALPIEERLRCSDLSASPPELTEPSAGKDIRLVAGEGIVLRASPEPNDQGGFAIKPLLGTTLEAIELERRGGFVRVEVPSPEGFLTGWVAVGSITKPQPSAYGVLGPISSNTRGKSKPSAATPHNGVTCEKPLRLAAGIPPVWLGEVRAGTTLLPMPKKETPPGWTRIELKGLGGRLFAREADLIASNCAVRVEVTAPPNEEQGGVEP